MRSSYRSASEQSMYEKQLLKNQEKWRNSYEKLFREVDEDARLSLLRSKAKASCNCDHVEAKIAVAHGPTCHGRQSATGRRGTKRNTLKKSIDLTQPHQSPPLVLNRYSAAPGLISKKEIEKAADESSSVHNELSIPADDLYVSAK